MRPFTHARLGETCERGSAQFSVLSQTRRCESELSTEHYALSPPALQLRYEYFTLFPGSIS